MLCCPRSTCTWKRVAILNLASRCSREMLRARNSFFTAGRNSICSWVSVAPTHGKFIGNGLQSETPGHSALNFRCESIPRKRWIGQDILFVLAYMMHRSAQNGISCSLARCTAAPRIACSKKKFSRGLPLSFSHSGNLLTQIDWPLSFGALVREI